MNVKEEIIEALKQHLTDGNPEPHLLKLPMSKARTLCGLDYEQLGNLSCELLRYGPCHLETTGLFGLKVQVVDEDQISFQ